MFDRRASKAVVAVVAAAALIGGMLSFVVAGTAYGTTISNALQAQTPFSPGTLDSGQGVNVVVPANSILTPGATIFILECSAPGGVDPTNISSCDGDTAYAGGTISVQSDGSIDVINTSTSSGLPYIVYALPDVHTFSENPSGSPKCGLGSANECVLYIGQGGGSDTGLSAPHVFSQAFQIHPDLTDSGTLNPGDGTFPADAAPAITSTNHTTFTKGTAGTFNVTATGYGPPTFTETGTLPAGVTLKTTFSGNSSTGVLAGTPTQSGSFPFTITANNGVGSPATQSFSLTVNAAPAITSANATTFTKGTAGTFTVTATGSPTPTLGESGTLPTGITFTPGTGVLAGTPTQSGSFPLTFTASNGVGSPATQSFTLTVNTSGTAPAITSANHTTFTEGTAGTFTVTATGSPTPTLGESGTLPTGVSFTPSTGALAGTPTVSGTFPITFTAGNGVGSPASQSFTLTVNAAPVITSANGTTFNVGAAGSFTVTATGFPAPTLGESGTLPTGVTFTPSTGALAGTPTVSGTFPITFTATNGVGSPASQSFTLTVDAALGFHISTTSLPNATVGLPYSVQLQTQGGVPPFKWKKTSKLPKGLSLNSTGLLSGTPSSKAVGSQSVGVTVTSNKTSTATATLPLMVDEAPAVTSASAVSFHDSTASSFSFTASGFPAPTFSETGTLPSGVTLSSAGVLSGTPVLPGTPPNSAVFPITVTATNGIGSPTSQSFILTVIAPLVIDTTSLPSTSPGATYNAQLMASGGLTPYKWKKLAAVPKGLKLSATAGMVTGVVSTKLAPGTYHLSVEVTDKEGKVHTSATATINLVVS